MNGKPQDASLLEDYYDAVASRLLPVILDRDPHSTLGVIGANDGVGASTVSVQLAISVSRLVERVLLMDAETNNNTASRAFQMEQHPGLIQALSGAKDFEDCIHNTHLPTLQVLPSGRTNGRQPIVGRDPGKLRVLLDRLRDQYSVIVVDLPSAADRLTGMSFSTALISRVTS